MLAAVAAARAGARTALLCKEPVGYGNTRMAVGLIACSGLPHDDRESFLADVLESGRHLSDPGLVEVLVDQAREALGVLEEYGLIYLRDEDGHLSEKTISRAGGHSRPRTLQILGAGVGLGHVLRAAVQKHSIALYEDTLLCELLKDGGEVRGVRAFDLVTGREFCLGAGAVVLCTGGGGWLFYPNTSNARTATGEGYALAFEAGAELVDMEQVQAIPFAVTYPEAFRGIICGEPAVAGPAGKIVDGKGKTLLDGGIYRMNRAEVVRHMAAAMAAGATGPNGGVYLDLRPNLALPKGPKVREQIQKTGMTDVVLPAYGRKAYNWEEPWEVAPTIHFFMGGVRADSLGRTNVPGLFVAGEVQGGVHGGNRLGSVALTEILVFGLRAGQAAALHARSREPVDFTSVPEKLTPLLGKEGSVKPVQLVRALQKILWKSAGLVRNAAGLEKALKELSSLEEQAMHVSIADTPVFNTDLQDFVELGFMLTTARLIITAALARRESRGAHLRDDFPEEGGEEWKKNIILSRDKDGKILVRLEGCSHAG